MVAHLGDTTDRGLVELAFNPDSIVGEATREALSPEEVECLRTALANSLEGVFVVGTAVAMVAFLVASAFPRGLSGKSHRPR